MSGTRQMGRWASVVPVEPMTAAAAAAIALQYTGDVKTLQATLTAAEVTAKVIETGIDKPLRLSITAHLVQQAASTDVGVVDIYAASHTGFSDGKPGVILERIGVATFSADGDAVIDGVGVDVEVAKAYPATVALSSDLLTEARTKVALDAVSGRTPATVEVTDPGECAAIVLVARAHATLDSVAEIGVVWRVWE